MRWTDLRAKKRSCSPRGNKSRALRNENFPRGYAARLSGAALVCFWGSMAFAWHAPSQAAASRTQPVQMTPAAPPSSISRSAQSNPAQLRYVVVLDPAHGGTDTGAVLGPGEPEKTYALSLAIRVHVLLNTRGIRSILTRDSDTMVDNTARAVTANRAHAAACILIHATATGNGVHLFTSSLPPIRQADPRRTFLPWQTAQASYITESLRLESDMNAALARNHVPVLLERSSLVPLDSTACPAVAIEVAPLNAKTPLTNAAYQEQIATALASALAEWRSDWRLQP
jgi:N-acetylmuramoyl-L-alanine amidase